MIDVNIQGIVGMLSSPVGGDSGLNIGIIVAVLVVIFVLMKS